MGNGVLALGPKPAKAGSTCALKHSGVSALRGSAAEDDAAKSVQGNGEKDTSNGSRRNDLRPDDGSIRSAIEHILREDHKMQTVPFCRTIFSACANAAVETAVTRTRLLPSCPGPA